jgi:hypothetical protein
MSRNLSATRTNNTLAIQFKKLLARIYLAFDESQRRRAAAMIYRYRHLIPDYDEKSTQRKQDRLTVKFTPEADIWQRDRRVQG